PARVVHSAAIGAQNLSGLALVPSIRRRMVVLPLFAPPTALDADHALDSARALLDLLSEGAASAPSRLDAELLRDLAWALAELAALTRSRAVVRGRRGRNAWELALERSGRDVLVTLFQGGALPEVAVHEQRFDGDGLAARVLAGLDAAIAGPPSGAHAL